MPAKVRSSTVATSHSTNVDISRPSGVRAGDVLIAIHYNDRDRSGTGAPTGWTSLASASGGDVAVRVWSKTAADDEPATYRFRQPSGANGTIHLLAVTDVDTSISPQVAVSTTVGPDPVTPSVKPAAGASLEIRAAGIVPLFGAALSWSPPSGYSMRGTADADFFVASAVAVRQINSSAAVGVLAFDLYDAIDVPGLGVTISLAATDAPGTGPPPPPFTPGRGSALYRYVFAGWDGTYLDDLELSSVTFDKRIGQAGAFSASIAVTPKTRDRIARIISPDPTVLNTGPGVVTCQIFRAGEPWGEYWITAASISQSGREAPQISLTGSTLDAYMLQVEIQEELAYEGEDQIDIARALIESMQGRDGADLRLLLQDGTSGVPRDHTYPANEGTYGQRLQELAELENGFEWMVNIATGASGIERQWVWGAPRLGSSQVEHVFSNARNGGDILSWSEEIDALRGGTYWRARGDSVSDDASTAGTPLISDPALAEAHLAAGWPRLDRTIARSSVSETATLEAYAAYWATNAPGALRVDQITVALGAEPTFTPNSLGDRARIFLHNDWHPLHSRERRIIGISITPPGREGGKEVAQLTFEGIEVPSG
ncbi:hypothetical protein [Streptomyces sp.]|uniref:hypothetical protein n=1 Tax=Streptomyces sp. TaxID=1931 RepID=UPI002F92504B